MNQGGANGMIVPGYNPGVDHYPVTLSGGEAVLVPELTRALGPQNIMAANNIASAGRRNMAFGGIAGSDAHYALDPITAAIKAAGQQSVFASGMVDKALNQGAAVGAVASLASVGPSGSDPVERWRGVATQALQMTNHYSAANLSAMMQRLKWESSGDPNAVNRWDRNFKNGTPSQGLWQVIKPTFDQYALPGYNKTILDPLSNALASIRYADATYGSLEKAYGKRHADGSVAGYDSGGVLPPGGIAVSNLATPEAVLNTEQWSSMHSIARSVAENSGDRGGGDMQVTFNIDGAQDPEMVAEIVAARFRAMYEDLQREYGTVRL